VRSAFAVGHSEAEDQVEVDMEYHKQMLALHLKANPREVLVGWYATASELNTFSALIQNFYSGQGDGTWPHPAVHLTVSTQPGKDLETHAYISAPVGVTAERAADSAAFIPVPYELRYGEADKSGLEAISNAKDTEERSASITSDVESLERAIEEVIALIDRVSRYVESVIDEEAPASTAMGQFLLNALALAPKVEPADIERDLYVFLFILYGCTLLMPLQQQPHSGCSGRFLPGQHHPHTDGAVQPASDCSTHSGRRRRRRERWRGQPAQPARRQGRSSEQPPGCHRRSPRIDNGGAMHVTNSRGATYPLMFLMSRFPRSDNYWVRTCLSIYFFFPLFLFLFPFPLSPYMPTLSLFVSFEHTIYLCSSLWLDAQTAWSGKKACGASESYLALFRKSPGLRRWSTAEVTADESELGFDPVSRSRILSGRGVSYDEMDIKLLDLSVARARASILVVVDLLNLSSSHAEVLCGQNGILDNRNVMLLSDRRAF